MLQLGFDSVRLGGHSRAAKPSRGALDGLGESRLVGGELLEDQEPRVDDHHAIKNVGPLVAIYEIECGGTGQLALIGFPHRLEGEGHQARLPQGVEGGFCAAGADRFGAAHQTETGERLPGSVVEDGQVFGLEIRNRLAFLVAHNEVQQDLVRGGLNGDTLRGSRLWAGRSHR